MGSKFSEEYKRLNSAQKEAVDTLSGPVMVVAGPGTGKTQVLALRIANILSKTDIKADGVLCLTFTNSAVEAMKARLTSYLGEAGDEVSVFTFHSFGMKIIESYFHVLGLESVPKLLDDLDTAILFDEVLAKNEWEYLRPRADRSRYFSDLRSLVSLLKRERITSKYFLAQVEAEIKKIKTDPDNISSRGESKGQLKKEVLGKIESLERSQEVAKFFDLYEEEKKRKNKENILLDYDDVLENLVKIVENSEDAAADIRERYLYVLVDEHQDSSRVQNEFLSRVWGEVESPDIFVVGDDRQLIYGFSGASIDHFQGFKKTFKDAKLITLVDNYRSTQVILDASHALLQSVMTGEKLQSQSKEHHPIRLLEAPSASDEIYAAAEDIKQKIKEGVSVNDCAILVPKNSQVRSALKMLHQSGIKVSSLDALNLFDQEEAQAFIRVLKIISNEGDAVSLAASFFDSTSGITPLEAHTYITSQKMREFSFENISTPTNQPLFGDDAVSKWIQKIIKLKEEVESGDLVEVIENIGREVLKDSATGLVTKKDILNTLLVLANKEKEKNNNITLKEFVVLLERLESFGEEVPLVTEVSEGVKVLTLHSSKGLEFDYVWIAHMDERGLAGGKRGGFTLPDSIAEKVLESDVDRIKRKLYVAITRAKRFCTLSYSKYSVGEAEQELARVIEDLPEEVFEKEEIYAKGGPASGEKRSELTELKKLVAGKYKDRYVSASLLNNFYECTWKWYFRNLLQLPEPENDSFIFGNKVHAAIDQILKTRKVVLPEDKEVAKVVERWVEARLKDISENRENELSVSLTDKNFPDFKIYGRIDLLEKLSDGTLRVTDFKTGSVRKKSDVEKLDEEGRLPSLGRQLAMYSYLLQSSPKWGGVKVSESRLEFLEAKNPKESIFDHQVTDEEIELLIKDIKDYDAFVKSGEWTERECHYNSYGKNTSCEYCALAEIFK